VKLTDAEIQILNHLADAWNDFCKLDNVLEHDSDEFSAAIHAAQDKIAIRVARRVNPDIWRTE
jgi:hypothetical protein